MHRLIFYEFLLVPKTFTSMHYAYIYTHINVHKNIGIHMHINIHINALSHIDIHIQDTKIP
jgi:hypothetical protein